MKDLLNRNRKAIVGLLTPAVVFVGAKAGLSLTDAEALAVASFVTAAVIQRVPNSIAPKGYYRPRRQQDPRPAVGLRAGRSAVRMLDVGPGATTATRTATPRPGTRTRPGRPHGSSTRCSSVRLSPRSTLTTSAATAPA